MCLLRPDSLDPGVRGRFAREISLPVPDAAARADILRLVTKRMTLAEDVDFVSIGKATPGFVGADLHALASEAGLVAVRRIVLEMSSSGVQEETASPSSAPYGMCATHQAIMTSLASTCPAASKSPSPGEDAMEEAPAVTDAPCPLCSLTIPSIHIPAAPSESPPPPDTRLLAQVCLADFMQAAKSVQPSAKREGFAVVPDVTWKDVGALAEVREWVYAHMS